MKTNLWVFFYLFCVFLFCFVLNHLFYLHLYNHNIKKTLYSSSVSNQNMRYCMRGKNSRISQTKYPCPKFYSSECLQLSLTVLFPVNNVFSWICHRIVESQNGFDWKGHLRPMDRIAIHQIKLPEVPSNLTLITSGMQHPQLLWDACFSPDNPVP